MPLRPVSSSHSAARQITKRDTARYALSWTNPVTREVVKVAITHTRGYLVQGQDHVEVQVKSPRGARLPITETGYRSHFIPALELINAGGPVAFVAAWIGREAKSRDWQKKESARAQGNLFDWADQAGKATKRSPAPKPAKTRTRPERRVVADPDHVADCEVSDSQMRRRMAARERGKTVRRPKGLGR